MKFAAVLLCLLRAAPWLAAQEPVPLLCAFDTFRRTPDGRWEDLSGNAAHARAVGSGLEVDDPLLKNLSLAFSVTTRIRVDRLPGDGNHWLFGKGDNAGWKIGVTKDGRLWWHASWGGGWYHGPWTTRRLPLGEWVHLALTVKRGGRMVLYLNGESILHSATPHPVQTVGNPFQAGRLGGGGYAAVESLRIYAAELAPDEVRADLENRLATRRGTARDVPEPPWSMRVTLGRFDRPKPFHGYVFPRKAAAVRVPGPHAVDWPRLRISDGQTLFADPAATRAETRIDVMLRDGGPWFRDATDRSIEPVGHWFRALNWRWGQQHVYTTDRTARSWAGDYEIWGFPMRIAGETAGALRRVSLRVGAEVLYEREEPLDSLTLILPANLGGKPYELSVNGAPAQPFDVHLRPIVAGRPADALMPVALRFGGIVATLPAPHVFAQADAWAEDEAALTAATPAAPREPPAAPLARHVESPVTTFLVALSAGMSGGLKTGDKHIERFSGDAAAYGRHLAALGFDRVFETATPRSNPEAIAALAAGLGAYGVRLGINLAGYSHEAQLGNPNIAFYAAFLPDWGDNLIRDLHLAAQRWGHGAASGGFFMGADNAGYVPYWDWAPPIPNRPWGRALIAMTGAPVPVYSIGPRCGPTKSYERVGTQRAFLEHVHAYNRTWASYGRFARALADVLPGVTFTLGSFGSSPGVGGRGGWPWASMPGGAIYDGFAIQTAYDWNELLGSKPLHNLALVDRLRSAAPDRATWSIVDDFGLNRGPETLLRDWAVVLSRGLRGIGGNFLAHDTGIGDAGSSPATGPVGTPACVAAEWRAPADVRRALRRRQMDGYRAATAWAQRFGGAYAAMRSAATVGILYSDDQAISRHLDAPDPEGPHEGKTTEALLLCAMAGWPARLVTMQELTRELDPRIEALLLVGLNRFDDTWSWYEGVEAQLAAFVARGGRVLRDHESVAPVESMATGLQLAAYVRQGSPDQLPWLLARNRPLVPVLRRHLAGISRGPVASDADSVWIFPSVAGDCLFVTVANFTPAPLDGQAAPTVRGTRDETAIAVLTRYRNASREVLPVSASLRWDTERPVYDLAAGRAVAPADPLDLTRTAVALLVLPKVAPVAPVVAVERGALAIGIPGCDGLPVEVVLRHGDRTLTLFGAVGTPLPLPAAVRDGATWSYTCRELATGLQTQGTLPAWPAEGVADDTQAHALAAFAVRRDRELVVALTARQSQDAAIVALAERLRAHYAAAGRTVRIGRADPTDVVLYRQPIQPLLRAPQWYTVPCDLVLLGTPSDNVLLLDQQRGGLLPDGEDVIFVWSPFRGGYHAVNLVAADADGLARAAERLWRHPQR